MKPVFSVRHASDQQTAIAPDPAGSLTRPLRTTMAIACGLGISNVYYNQPLLAQIARTFHASAGQVGILPTLTQMGFALGVFFVAPLGDVLERRRLILTMLALVTVSLVAAALAPNLACLAAFSLAIGVTSVISTLVLPFAIALARPDERGATVGNIVSAMLIGILLSRTLSGAIGQLWGWRVMYTIASGLMIALALALRALLPRSQPPTTLSYGNLLRSMLGFLRTKPVLREATLNGMLLYAALSAFWATLVFLIEGPAYRYGPAVAGMFGLVAAGGALLAPLVGRMADRHSPRFLVGIATCGMLAGFLLLWAFGSYLWGLIAGIIILDVAAQSATISNQASVYSLASEAHSRLYTVYRAAYSLGGSFGAYLGAYGWSVAGWSGVCAVGVGLLVMALLFHVNIQAHARRVVNLDTV
jgi:predicted MFS family arabinose efflux permease